MAEVTLGGNPSSTYADLPALGVMAPAFKLTKDDLTDVTLSDYAGKKIILNVFPSVDTGVCAASVRKFNEAASNLDNTMVFCVSADLPFAQKRFCGAEGIENVVMMSTFRDGQSFGKQYGTLLVDGGFQGLHTRAVIIIDDQGMISYTELVPEIGQEPNYEAALAAL